VGADGIVFGYGGPTSRAEALVAGRAFGQAKAHVGTAGRTGPGGVEATVGAVKLSVLQQEIALRADPLPAVGAGAHVAGVVGGADRASEQDQARFGGKDGGRGAVLELKSLTTLGAGLRGVQDPCLAGRAAAGEEQAALGAEPGAGCEGEVTAGTGEAEGEPALGAGLRLLILEGTAAARAKDLTTG
jgi:hypothetical protein